jgi:hypothetical protein
MGGGVRPERPALSITAKHRDTIMKTKTNRVLPADVCRPVPGGLDGVSQRPVAGGMTV